MKDQPLEFKPLSFTKTVHGNLRPPLFDGDHTHGNNYTVSQLVSLHHAQNALVIVARFSPGPDAREMGWESQSGEVEFLLMKRQGRYLGTITRQAPENFLGFSTGEKVSVLDGLGHEGSGLGGRQAAHFWCALRLRGMRSRIDVTVSVYIKLGWFGKWKEIVVKLPKKDLYVARP